LLYRFYKLLVLDIRSFTHVELGVQLCISFFQTICGKEDSKSNSNVILPIVTVKVIYKTFAQTCVIDSKDMHFRVLCFNS
jgi:hypothetical protein